MMNANAILPKLDRVRQANWSAAELPIDWRSYLGARGLLVMIIHGTWCHACLERLVWLRRQRSWFNEQGIGILAVSADDPVQVAAFHQSLWSPLPFTLISDANAALSRALGLVDDKAARSALLLVDCDGNVRFSQIDQHDIPEQFTLRDAIKKLSACT